MTAILTAAQMRALEQAAISGGAVTGLELMERAGQGVVDAVLAEWPDLTEGPRRAVVLCGPGNNGGDGFVVARLLKERGWAVEVFLYGDAEKLPADAATNFRHWVTLGDVRPLAEGWMDAVPVPDLLVDALFGTGLSRPFDPPLVDALHPLLAFSRPWKSEPRVGPRRRERVVAIDIPSGVCADSGRMLLPAEALALAEEDASDDGRWPRVMAHALRADLTVTFHNAKLGHYLAQAPVWSKALRVMPLPGLDAVDLGTPPDVDGILGVRLLEPKLFGRPVKLQMVFGDLPKVQGHKYAHGHALFLAGRPGRGGAARLAARGALRIGAGLVTLAVPPAALQENAARLDAIMLRSVNDAPAFAALLEDARLNALCAGPGMGTGDREAALLAALLDAAPPGGKGRAVVLDADALTLLAAHPDLRAKLHPRVVLTPHEGEFARLFPAIDARWRAPATKGPAFSKVDAAREAAAEAGCVVLLKGPDTVIADPTGRAAINSAAYDRAAPWLATAGSGDVLAGMITGLLARGFAPHEAACTAAWLHVEAARSFGSGLIAEDLPDELPKVFRALGL